jgi:hypothetical protein
MIDLDDLFNDSNWRTAELPIFVPPDDRKLTNDEAEGTFGPSDPVHAAAREKCKMGDETAMSLVKELIGNGLPPASLQMCLAYATSAHCIPLVKDLLTLGVPVSPTAARSAIKLKALDILSLFVAHGWDIKKHEAPEIPGYLT